VLWEADSAWSDTLAGVVEAVVLEIGLDSQQAVQLIEALGNQGSWGRTVRAQPAAASHFPDTPNSPDRGIEIASVAQFILELQKAPRDFDDWAARRFAKEKFTANDVPQLVAAIRAAEYSTDNRLFSFGPFLLVRHGIDNPEVLAELDRLLAHQERLVRANTIDAFGYSGASPFYSPEEWTASKAADEFAVPRLVRICRDHDESDSIRDGARKVLAEIAHRRPEYAADAMAIIVDLLAKDRWPQYVNDISRLAEVNTDAAIAVVPRLREMLKILDEQFAGTPASPDNVLSQLAVLRRRQSEVLEAMSAIAHHNPVLAHDIALEFLRRMRDGLPAGPFSTLLSPGTPDTNRMVVLELLNNAYVEKDEPRTQAPLSDIGRDARTALAAIARQIRDWRATKEGKND
jgi:hypothetical protein